MTTIKIILPKFFYKGFQWCQHQKEESHKVKRTKGLPYSKHQFQSLKFKKINITQLIFFFYINYEVIKMYCIC